MCPSTRDPQPWRPDEGGGRAKKKGAGEVTSEEKGHVRFQAVVNDKAPLTRLFAIPPVGINPKICTHPSPPRDTGTTAPSCKSKNVSVSPPRTGFHGEGSIPTRLGLRTILSVATERVLSQLRNAWRNLLFSPRFCGWLNACAKPRRESRRFVDEREKPASFTQQQNPPSLLSK